MDWDPRFMDRTPALAAFAPVAAPLRECPRWPDRAQLQSMCDARGVVNARGAALRLVGESEDDYEDRIYRDGEIHVREGLWHDLFNVLAWLAWPQTKAVLNELHCMSGGNPGVVAGCTGSARGRVRDALTVFDENGVIVASSDPGLLDRVRAFQWKELFWFGRRRVVECMHVFTLGHALAEKALTPYVGMSAHAILIAVGDDFGRSPREAQVAEIDGLAAQFARSAGAFATPQKLAPLPVLGIPGWCAENAQGAFYENASYFRAGRRGRA